MTAKELLSANRDSVISSIKYVFRVWKQEDVKQKMVEFLAYVEQNVNVDEMASAKNTKTLLKYQVQKMCKAQKPVSSDNRKWYEIAEDIADQRGLYRCSKTGQFTDINGNVVRV